MIHLCVVTHRNSAASTPIVVAALPGVRIAKPLAVTAESHSASHVVDATTDETRILERVQNQRQVVDYTLRRRSLLSQFHSGMASRLDVCDAQPHLLQAAKFHGTTADTSCPVCPASNLTHVCWIYGKELKQASGSARAPVELQGMADLFTEFDVFVVEVCRACGWNHLIQSYVLGTGKSQPHPHRTAGQ